MKTSYASYLWKRIVRLLIPTWIFLTLYLFLKGNIAHESTNVNEIFYIYLLSAPNFGYIWIIRVFFLIAVLSPFIYFITKKISSNLFLCFSLIGFLLTDILSLISSDYYYKAVVMMIPYSLIFALGIIAVKLPKSELKAMSVFCFAVFSLYAVVLFQQNNHFIPTQYYKEPPRIYYVSYALGATLFLYIIREKIKDCAYKLKLYKFLLFIGSHTIWLYFWHIPLLTIYRRFDYNKVLYFSCVFLTSLLITFVQSKITLYVSSKINNTTLRVNLLRIFNG